MSEEREEKGGAKPPGEEGRAGEAPGRADDAPGRAGAGDAAPRGEWDDDDRVGGDKEDWDEDGWPDEVTPDDAAAGEFEWTVIEGPRRKGEGAGGPASGAPGVGPAGAEAAPAAAPGETQAEATRRSGIAYAAGLTLFITVVSFMGLGWLLDRWLGTSWLLVAGIVVGSVAGFTQFVRIITRIK